MLVLIENPLILLGALCVKAGVPAFTAPQPKEAMDALLKRAKELSVCLFSILA
jgi:hypothetical protein